jgi:predicted dehydrogenase
MVAAVVGPVTVVSACNSIINPAVAVIGTDEHIARTCHDHMLLHTRHSSGCVGNIEIVGGDTSPLVFELTGSRGRLSISGQHPGGYQCAELSVTCASGEPQPAPEFPELSQSAVNVARLYRRLEMDIRNDTRHSADFADALRLTELLYAIEISSDERRAIAPQYGSESF